MKKTRFILIAGALMLAVAAGMAQATFKLPLPEGYVQGQGLAINDNDQIVGILSQQLNGGLSVPQPWAPFVYTRATNTTEILSGANLGSYSYRAEDISNNGSFVIGSYNSGTGASAPWMWDNTNQFTLLPVTPGYSSAMALVIKEDEQNAIYGWAFKDGDPNTYNVKWVQGSGYHLIDENVPYVSSHDNTTNILGHDAGWTSSYDPSQGKWVTAPILKEQHVPEPSIILFLGLGLISVAGLKKRLRTTRDRARAE